MKKIYTLFAFLLIGAVTFGQQNAPVEQDRPLLPAKEVNFHKDMRNNKAASGWADYASAYETLYGSTPYGLTGNLLFPDSTILVDYGGSGFGAPWIHRIAQHFDLDALAFQNAGLTVNSSNSFTVDSIQLAGVYYRVDNSVTDTLIVKVAEPTTSNLNGTGGFVDPVAANLNTDTVWFVDHVWDYATTSTPGLTATYKIPLDDAAYADSLSSGIHVFTIPTSAVINNGQSPAFFNNKFSIFVEFKPGYTWTANMDTLQYNKNAWFFGSYELEGQATYPTYSKQDYNCSFILPIDVRYNNAGGWNGFYIPSYAYMGSTPNYAYEAMAISAYVNQGVGIEENTANAFDVTAYPNPTNGEFTLNYTLDEQANTTVKVIDITGKAVYSTTDNQASGVHNVKLDLSDLDSGVYFYTISTEKETTTKKLIIE